MSQVEHLNSLKSQIADLDYGSPLLKVPALPTLIFNLQEYKAELGHPEDDLFQGPLKSMDYDEYSELCQIADAIFIELVILTEGEARELVPSELMRLIGDMPMEGLHQVWEDLVDTWIEDPENQIDTPEWSMKDQLCWALAEYKETGDFSPSLVMTFLELQEGETTEGTKALLELAGDAGISIDDLIEAFVEDEEPRGERQMGFIS
jgi:hypothetical protein